VFNAMKVDILKHVNFTYILNLNLYTYYKIGYKTLKTQQHPPPSSHVEKTAMRGRVRDE
jgi:hypothetical protein